VVLEYSGKKSKKKFKLQEVFSEHGIRVFLENGLGRFQAFLILLI
jgi:hypothetical protein